VKKFFTDMLGVLALVALLSPYLALILGLSLIATGAAALLGVSAVAGYFSVGVIVYGVFAIFTFAYLVTFAYLQCCVGLDSFWNHLRHRGWQETGFDLLGAVIWPWVWFVFDRNLHAFRLTFADSVLHVLQQWFVGSWRGTSLTVFNPATGETKTVYVKSGEQSSAMIAKEILHKDEKLH